nr:Chain B, WD repeat-containing protein PAC11 [Saccharomyces cerevisiae S288C]4HT6_D Chain D, WD repeat-containing protein PAC11 [Saccharomyces cerevisiae S288C]4HT6_F Chain F, WD repeat-containing protein PAC11 [Saccharomyces cerevisiae S288C]
ITYDKGIQTDQ